ncbi:SHOCT domain-containing protein [Inmirania thermothiophila]|uniref:Putative membrane protein n=1 Tax=Inmirania thermothiophila TaxID=1750597 RepID=A0A3N1Y7H5_9GAMM|nr:SHOCT domain-containing protein [Inmirania thermothiophila]ROR34786.1 putative membrane protein [Inmirania thermothiophila]
MHDGGGAWGWAWMGLGGIGMVLFWVLVLVAVVWIVRALLGGGSGREEDPLVVLKRRYARGEIDRETYERMREALRRD